MTFVPPNVDSEPSVWRLAEICLRASEAADKVRLTQDAAALWRSGEVPARDAAEAVQVDFPGRPERPLLVEPRQLKQRGLGSEQGRAALVHAVAHIEFNAINLAWDAVVRFTGLPDDFYRDWALVAEEEAAHFAMMRERLAELGYEYGDFPAHNGLWEMAQRTASSPLERMALVPRVLEARGLDVTPGMIRRFQAIGDQRTVDCLEVILRDEVGHVEAGSRWFRFLCRQQGLEPEATYLDLIRRKLGGGIRCPLNLDARRRAGFEDSELVALRELCNADR